MFGIASFSIIPIKKEPSHRSETVNQLLFNDLVKVIDKIDEWIYIESIDDKYVGWCQEVLIMPLNDEEFVSQSKINKKFNPFPSIIIEDVNSKDKINLPFGCSLSIENQYVILNNRKFNLEIELYKPNSNLSESIVECALIYLNTPYLWGGKTVFGTDCSGFSQTVFRMNGIQLPRDAYQQAEIGTTIDFIEEAKAGDLAFFDNLEGKITHVGIMLSSETIIHASSYVKINKIDHVGIFDEKTNKYSHQLRIIKRVDNLQQDFK
ncbi:MAG: C40 family peptidase [Bacteroidota bacterium]